MLDVFVTTFDKRDNVRSEIFQRGVVCIVEQIVRTWAEITCLIKHLVILFNLMESEDAGQKLHYGLDVLVFELVLFYTFP